MSTRRKIIKDNNLRIKKSKIFITPMLRQNFMHEGKNNSYHIDTSLYGTNQFMLTFDNVDHEPLKMDIYKLQNHTEFCDIGYGDNNKEINILMNIPKEFQSDYEKFLDGKYSKFGMVYKALLVKKYGDERHEGFNERNHLPNLSVFDVIYPNENSRERLAESLSIGNSKIIFDNKDIEIIDSPDLELETFKTIEELINIYGSK